MSATHESAPQSDGHHGAPAAAPAGSAGAALMPSIAELQRILSLSTNVGPETSLDAFSQQVARVACEIGDFAFTVIFLLDAIDGAFYAEAMHGLANEPWHEFLAMAVPKRVYERVTHADQSRASILLHDAPELDDPEVALCFGPLQTSPLGSEDPARTGATGPSMPCDLLLVPLEVLGRGVIGFCAAGFPAGRSLGPSAGLAMQALASQAAVFIENIRLYRMQAEEAAVSSALLQVAGVVGTTDTDLLAQRTLGILPRLFGAQAAALLYLDHRRSELRLLEPRESGGQLTAFTEAKVVSAKLERLEPVLHGKDPVAIEELEVDQLLPHGLVQARNVRSALIIPLDLSDRQANALIVFWTRAAHRFRARDLDVARGVSELVGVAFSNARLFADASDRAEQLASLYRTGQMMSSSLDLDGTLKTITAAAVQLTRSSLCVIYLIDPTSGLLEYVAGAGPGGGGTLRTTIRPGEGLLGRCVLVGQPILVEELAQAPLSLWEEPDSGSDLHAALFLPLIASGEVIGVLATAAELPGYYLPEHQEIVQAFANQAAVAIERGRLYAAEQRRRQIAELQQTMTQALGSTLEFREVMLAVLHYAQLFLANDLAAVHVFNGTSIDLAISRDASGSLAEAPFHGPYTFAEPLYGQVRDTGAPVVVSDTAREPLWHAPRLPVAARSWLGVPLLIDGDYLVLLDVFSEQAGRYTQGDADAMAEFAHQVAFAVRNARIYAREREAKMRLEDLDQLRADFVSTVSHELRTPLTGIKGFTETLLTYWSRLDDERKHHYLERIYSASKRLQRLVQDLLFVSRVEGGALPLTVRKVQLADLIDPAVMEIKQKYREQEIEVEVPDDLPLVLADADRAQQILVNLMDNAVKYSPEGSPITVRAGVLDDIVQLTVIDHGPGIRPQDVPRLFTRFSKIDQVIRAGHVGTGLGLFISKQLVEQMNGTISFTTVVGKGSAFSFALPRIGNQPE